MSSCKHFQHQEQYQRHQQQRQKMWKYCNGFFIAATSRSIGPYCSRLPLKSLFVLIYIVVLMPAACRGSVDYSPKLTNCYDAKHGFDENINGLNALKVERDSVNYGVLLANATQQQDTLPALVPPPPAVHSATSVSGWKCCCWNAINQEEIECRCEGEALTRVPQTLAVSMQRLTIASASLPRLRSTGLKVYAASLLDIVLTDLKYLECIEDGAFSSLKLLRTIYISHAPMLTFLSKDVFQGISESIKIIRIINSGLIRVPDLVHLPPENILQMIDLDNNHITRIDKQSIRIKTEQLILANNDISFIDDSAFFGSQIAMLTLKENRLLQEVHPNAFSGISMQQLDLSSTSLIRLPSAGLQDIEELRIENTHTLKTIPSIYNFQNLQRAYLTHSFHCCAFQYPSRHDPRRHAARMLEIAEWQQHCKQNVVQDTTAASAENANRDVFAPVETKKLDVKQQQEQMLLRQLRDVKQRKTKRQIKLNSKENVGGFSSSQEESTTKASSNPANSDKFMPYANRTHLDNLEVGNPFDISNDEYMSDSMIKEIGTFHEEIIIDPNESQLDEYCGNFTHRQRKVECYPLPNALNPCEDVMGYQWLRISVWIVLFLAVVGNVAVLMVILTIKSEAASVQRFLMCHLAFADLCLGLYLLLIASIDAHSMGEYFNYAYDWQYGVGCKLAGFLTVFASHLSVFTLTIITIERWLAITHAMYLNRRIKLKSAAFIMAAGWIMSIVMSLLPLFGISNYSSTSICLPMENRDLFDTVYLVSILGLNGVAFCIIAICYIQIYLSLGYETRHARNTNPGEMSIAKKMALLVFTNFSCWAPIAFFGLTALAGYPLINVTKSKILLVFFYPLNSCADPYLYAILTSQYRQDLYTFLAKFGICKRRAHKFRDSISQHGTTNISLQGSSIQRQCSLSPKLKHSNALESECMLKERCDFV